MFLFLYMRQAPTSKITKNSNKGIHLYQKPAAYAPRGMIWFFTFYSLWMKEWVTLKERNNTQATSEGKVIVKEILNLTDEQKRNEEGGEDGGELSILGEVAKYSLRWKCERDMKPLSGAHWLENQIKEDIGWFINEWGNQY